MWQIIADIQSSFLAVPFSWTNTLKGINFVYNEITFTPRSAKSRIRDEAST
jgi:hypothetical protein